MAPNALALETRGEMVYAMIRRRDLDPREVELAGDAHVEVWVRWGDAFRSVTHVRPGETLAIGDDGLPARDGACVLRWRGADPVFIAPSDPRAGTAMQPGERYEAPLGPLTVSARRVAAPRPLAPRPLVSDPALLSSSLAAIALVALGLVTLNAASMLTEATLAPPWNGIGDSWLRALAGRVVVRFVIGANGAVMGASAGESSLGDARVDACVASAVRRWQFPAPEGGSVVTVNYPFELRPAE